MSNTVVFKTPTLLDIRAITTFGLHAKPNTPNPIGYFGTGLKMAIAVLVRNNIPIRLWIGNREYEFYTYNGKFRDVDTQFIRMRERTGIKKWFHTDLGFTTQTAKDWEVWMAYRELESNTRDEEGMTYIMSSGEEAPYPSGYTTTIAVGPSDKFVEAAEGKEGVFLPNGLRGDVADQPDFQVIDKPSSYLYYRGMRVMKLEQPSLMTYNILKKQELTEDRTLKDQWWMPYQLVRWLGANQDLKLVNRFMDATDKNWEYSLPLDSVDAPSEVFISTMEKRRKAALKKLGQQDGAIPIYGGGRAHTFYTGYTRSKGPTLGKVFKEWLDRQSVDGNHITDEDMRMLTKVESKLNTEEIPF